MMANKLAWKVDEAPTGPYRSFHRRGWPSAYLAGRTAINIRCEDEYTPRKARCGEHHELTISVADHRNGPAFVWRTLKAKAATLAEAKEMAQKFVDANPSFFGIA